MVHNLGLAVIRHAVSDCNNGIEGSQSVFRAPRDEVRGVHRNQKGGRFAQTLKPQNKLRRVFGVIYGKRLAEGVDACELESSSVAAIFERPIGSAVLGVGEPRLGYRQRRNARFVLEIQSPLDIKLDLTMHTPQANLTYSLPPSLHDSMCYDPHILGFRNAFIDMKALRKV